MSVATDKMHPFIEYCDECQESTYAAWVEHHNATYDAMAERVAQRKESRGPSRTAERDDERAGRAP
jgi:hypothetical protein